MNKNTIAAILSAAPLALFTIKLDTDSTKVFRAGTVALVGDDAVSVTRSDGTVVYLDVADIRYLTADTSKLEGIERDTVEAALTFWLRAGMVEHMPEYELAKGQAEAPLSADGVRRLMARLTA